jgi:hypothetical protein
MAKRVQLKITLTMNFGAGHADYSAEFSAFSWNLNREKVDAKNFGHVSDRYELGLTMWSFEGTVRPEVSSAFRKLCLQAMVAGTDVEVIYRPEAAIEGLTNPTITGSVKFQKPPGYGGSHGALEGETQITLEGNTSCLWDDGTTEITIG